MLVTIVVIKFVMTCFEGPTNVGRHTRHDRSQVSIELRLPSYQLIVLDGINYFRICRTSIDTIDHIHRNFHNVLEGPECTILIHEVRKVEIVTEGRLLRITIEDTLS